nr:PHD finger protein 20-like [Onthophagus taurus]
MIIYFFFLLSPEGRRFRLRSEIKNYIEEHPELNLKEKMFDFSISRRPTKRSRNESRRSTTSRVTSEPVVVQEPAETTTNVEEEPAQDNLNSLKIPLIDNSYKCPIEGCGKNFRRENLAQMHVKHYHPEYTKYLDSTPNVADLAYARTVGESLDRSPGPEKQQRLSTNTKSTSKLTPKITQKEPNSVLEASHSEIIKLLSSKSDSNKKDEPTSPILPSGLPPSMYPDIKLKDLLTKSEAIPKRDDINMKALISSTQRPSLKIKEEIDTDSPKSSSNKHNQKRKRIASESIEIKQEIKQEVLDPAIDLPPTQPPINNVIIEGGEVIKIVQMKREEIINCTCGITEEDGLMIQCELCLCWQHAYCNNIQRESQVPDKYICYICQNPIRQRSSKKYFHDQDWLKHGTLPVGSFHCKDESILKERFEKLKKTHDLSGGLLELKDYLHTLKVKIKIAEAKNHPKLYLWSKPWEKLPLPEKTEEEASNIKPDDSMLLTLLKNKDSQSSSESTEFPKLDLNTFMGNNLENIQLQTPRIPQPEAAIDSADCRLNLLEHISHSQSLVEERLMEFEDQIDKLDTFLDMDENDIDFDPKVRQTTQMLMRDLNVLKELSQMNTF